MNLNGLKKSAQLLMLIGNQKSIEVIKQLHTTEIEKIIYAITNIKKISSEDIQIIYSEYKLLFKKIYLENINNNDYCLPLLQKALGEKKTEYILKNIHQKKNLEKHICMLNKTSSKEIANLLSKEHPQFAALLLMHLNLTKSAEILSLLENKKCAHIILRIASSKKLSKYTNDIFSKIINLILLKKNTIANNFSGISYAKNLLSILNKNIKTKIINNIIETNKNLSKKILNQVFLFEDIIKLSNKDIKCIFQEIDTESLFLSMYNMSQDFKKKILKNLSANKLNNFYNFIKNKTFSEVSSRMIQNKQNFIMKIIKLLVQQKKITTNILG
ncbi:flagellar motor switch protein [Buchnera aphidicola (Nipponaphis monzeni)]|uniref:Flagellar motor switch protein FliG n=1 Tax=Buchnera aphidicola (Nipponaphis monzeni) TaxID=2495405 RepID=A0A455T9U7_9GAMM|nr:FliG C-terminal domain-containing protein [Buchnera aphidicola]BBI01075.1 flagellar motor switch protein [Buchnera aphidicola (Nipponaphis monzeni)]